MTQVSTLSFSRRAGDGIFSPGLECEQKKKVPRYAFSVIRNRGRTQESEFQSILQNPWTIYSVIALVTMRSPVSPDLISLHIA
jgi:hypothetical protein